MTAGRGIIHSEEPEKGEVHSLQLWLNLPSSKKMVEPRYQDLRGAEMPVRKEPGATLRIYSGSSGDVKAPTQNNVPVTMVEMRLAAGATATQDLPADYNGFIYLIAGSGRFGEGNDLARAAQAVWISPGDEITVTAVEPLHAMLWAGRPLHEPIAAYGPFVMSTPEQIREAFADYQAGRF
jgi:redox-sensitive bicupin YhaK (pirin superfamily)